MMDIFEYAQFISIKPTATRQQTSKKGKFM